MKCPYCHKDIKDSEIGEFFECSHCNSSLQLENQELILLKEGEEPAEPMDPSSTVSDVSQESRLESAEDFNHKDHEEVFKEEPKEEPTQVTSPEHFSPQVESENSSESEKVESLEDIVQFGNSNFSPKDHFVYNLTISGSLSGESYDRLQKILESQVLKLDASFLLSKFKNEKLSISNLNAVKIVYLIRKLSSLPVKIHWTQESRLSILKKD